ncbi:signal peptide peptidase SppA [Celerinatantimonas yamalensis]|uniref:Signal peptide peptidase SppA n=1 Tax=Celerinatantimonas yamalensis TaxID=559956 RepID=A0ABW9G3F9_9GAMM
MKFLFKLIGRILRGCWLVINFIRQFIMNILVFGLIIGLIIGFSQHSNDNHPVLSGRNALTLNLDGKLVEKTRLTGDLTRFVQRFIGTDLPDEIAIHPLIHTIEQAKTDTRINGLVLNLNDLQPSGLTKLEMLGKAINNFKKSGKPVIAIADNYDQGQYFLASFANQIILNPAGSVMIKGLSANQLFYKDALDKLGVTMHVFRVGIYKSFVEPYLRNGMSQPARADLTRWINQLWQDYTQQVAHNRDISAGNVAPSGSELLAKLKQVDGNGAQYALKNKLVDHLFTRSQVHQYLVHLFGIQGDNSYNHIDLTDYQAIQPPLYQSLKQNGSQIAVLTAEGAIVDGSGSNSMIASDDMLNALNKVQNDPHIKALVLRVDSPGGSAFAAELIRSKLASIQKAGKPVIVSMGSVAASGGYWISSTANRIFAMPTTITGSIGIFGIFATGEAGLSKLGIHSDGVATTDYATISPLAPLPDDVAKILQLNVENGYHQFVSLVQKGRHYPNFAAVDQLAQGRIWTGREAKANGLVDQLGGLQDAIAYAAKTVKLSHYSLVNIVPDSNSQHWIGQLLHSEIGQWLSSQFPWMGQFISVKQQAPLALLREDPQHLFGYCNLCRAID